ncbi:phosphate ABC transporter substrate-binding protein [Heliorestis acidaminivorans]|uniref:Phosphate-binding protein n=1 Tax=Heliorestis acidaminivorans TaxID=553427 RepID=A0A6I0F0M8_9FIRM|nr:phosphate ABC transporter substrate-binding protein [Heliorestis acidaminivorans]KAB2954506.1 phosphate ABC transporter substrate-binding protein [Heliorestis acidaminivorans]
MDFKSKLKRIITTSSMIALVGLLTVGCGGEPRESIQVKGSDTIVNMTQFLAEEYMIQHDVSIAVTGGGSGTGISALINGTADIAITSRDIKDNEIATILDRTGKEVVEYTVALDGLAFIVHRDNPIDELTIGQLKDIYTGKISNWSELGGPDQAIVVMARETSSGTHVFVKEFVMNNEEYRPDALLLTSSGTISKEIVTNRNAVGYVGVGYLTDDVKTIAIKLNEEAVAVLPTDEGIKDGSYPISRPLHFYTAGEAEGLAKDFIDFVLSEEGQKIVGEMEFVSIL